MVCYIDIVKHWAFDKSGIITPSYCYISCKLPQHRDRETGAVFAFTMKEFARAFYKSKAWQDCRNGYMQKVHGLCENCLKQGIYKPAQIVHHIVELTPENINDPRIALSWDNLRAVCRECHAIEHGAHDRRYKVDDMGRVSL